MLPSGWPSCCRTLATAAASVTMRLQSSFPNETLAWRYCMLLGTLRLKVPCTSLQPAPARWAGSSAGCKDAYGADGCQVRAHAVAAPCLRRIVLQAARQSARQGSGHRAQLSYCGLLRHLASRLPERCTPALAPPAGPPVTRATVAAFSASTPPPGITLMRLPPWATSSASCCRPSITDCWPPAQGVKCHQEGRMHGRRARRASPCRCVGHVSPVPAAAAAAAGHIVGTSGHRGEV